MNSQNYKIYFDFYRGKREITIYFEDHSWYDTNREGFEVYVTLDENQNEDLHDLRYDCEYLTTKSTTAKELD